MNKHFLSKQLLGKYVNLREITLDDAQFVLDLRCDSNKSKFLHKTENNLDKQIDYIKSYFKKDLEWYFIIEDLNHVPLGTLRIYDVVDNHYTSGSWLMKDGSTLAQAVEGIILFKDFAFNELGFDKDIFDVRKQNKKVLNFHKMCGAKILSEDQENYYFDLTRETFNKKIPFLYSLIENC